MSQTKNLVFKGLIIISWIIFVGLCIEAGGLLVNFIFNWFNPELVQNLYQKLDFSNMYKNNKWVFFSMYGFILMIAILKVLLFYIVSMLATQIDLTKPFNLHVSKQILLISYYTLSIGLISYIAQQSSKNFQHYGFDTSNLNSFWADSEAFILMAAIIYIIAIIFKKGIEIQNENELTI